MTKIYLKVVGAEILFNNSFPYQVKDKDGKKYVEYKVDNKKFFKMIVDTFYVQAD